MQSLFLYRGLSPHPPIATNRCTVRRYFQNALCDMQDVSAAAGGPYNAVTA
jgi:hypothetical protein